MFTSQREVENYLNGQPVHILKELGKIGWVRVVSPQFARAESRKPKEATATETKEVDADLMPVRAAQWNMRKL